MLLREEHFAGRSFQSAPLADVALQGAQHAVREADFLDRVEAMADEHLPPGWPLVLIAKDETNRLT